MPTDIVEDAADETPVVTGSAVADIEPAVLGTGPAVQKMEPAVSDREPAVRNKGLSSDDDGEESELEDDDPDYTFGISHNILMPACDIDRAVKHLRESGGLILYLEVCDRDHGIQKAKSIKDKLQKEETKGYQGVVESKYVAMQEFNCVIAYQYGSFVKGLSRLPSGPDASICGYSFSFSKAICGGMNEINVAVMKDPSSRGPWQCFNCTLADYDFMLYNRVRLFMAHMFHDNAVLLRNMINTKLTLREIQHPWGYGYHRIWWIGNIGGLQLPPGLFKPCLDYTPGRGHAWDYCLPHIETVRVMGICGVSAYHFRMEMLLPPPTKEGPQRNKKGLIHYSPPESE